MAVAVLVATVSAPVNTGVRGLYDALVAWLTANPGVLIVDVDTFRFESEFEADQQTIRILYQTGMDITGGWEARLYVSSLVTAGLSAQQQFTNDMTAGATFVPWFTLDVTKHVTGRVTADSFIIIGVNTVTDPFGFNGKNTWIAEPLNDILGGASGLCTLYDGAGVSLGTVTVTNVGPDTWIQFQRNYAVMDDTTGFLIGLATCDAPAAAFVSPALTTTTPYPCPTYFPQTLPQTAPF